MDATAEHAGLSAEDAIRRGLHAIVRTSSGRFVHAPAANPPAGEFRTYVAAEEADRICADMARNERFGGERMLGGKGRGGRPWSSSANRSRYGTKTHYACGHPRTPANTYGAGSRSKCRICSLEKTKVYREEHRDEVRNRARLYRERHPEKTAAYRKTHRLAHQLYNDIRRLAMRDGLWITKPRERSAA